VYKSYVKHRYSVRPTRPDGTFSDELPISDRVRIREVTINFSAPKDQYHQAKTGANPPDFLGEIWKRSNVGRDLDVEM